MSTAAIAAELRSTNEAARQQINRLVETGLLFGLVEAPRGAGRPNRNWSLTARGHARFPDRHAELMRDMIDSVRQTFGEAGLEQLISQREAAARSTYLAACEHLPELDARLRKLAELRDREGYMARIEIEGKDWLLIEDHCPICVAAQACQGFCRAELELFREVLGADAQVVREQHLLAGARRCVYRIGMKKTIGTPLRVTA